MRIVHAIHDFLPAHRAGSEIYALELCRALARRHDVTIMCAEYDRARSHGTVVWREVEGLPVAEIINNWRARSFADTYASRAINRSLSRVLERIRPDVLHVHNLLNLSFDLPALARARGIPSVATLHDYTLVCPSGGQRVHMAEQHVCIDIDTARCARCFPQSPFYRQISGWDLPDSIRQSSTFIKLTQVMARHAPQKFESIRRRAQPDIRVTTSDVERRLRKARAVLEQIDLVVGPSAALGSEYLRLGLPAEKLVVSDYGFAPLTPARRSPSSRLRVGFVGTLVWHKGAHILIDAIRGVPADRMEVKIFGNLDHFPDYVSDLRAQAAGLPVCFMGGFDGNRTAEVYAQLDVLVVPSLWPENSPLVIHEAFMAGVPVVGARQGGIPELVTHGVNGLTYDAYSSADLRAALERLLDEPALLERFRHKLPEVKSIEQDAEAWESRYHGLVTKGVGARQT